MKYGPQQDYLGPDKSMEYVSWWDLSSLLVTETGRIGSKTCKHLKHSVGRVGGIVPDRTEEFIFPSVTVCRATDPYDTTVFFFFYQCVEPVGISCLDVTWPAHLGPCTGHYALVEVVEQHVANIGWLEPPLGEKCACAARPDQVIMNS